MRGRGSGTHDEEVAATYIGSEFRRCGLEPAGGNGGYAEQVEMEQGIVTSPPVLKLGSEGEQIVFTHGAEMLVLGVQSSVTEGPLRKFDAKLGGTEPSVKTGAAILLNPKTGEGAPSPQSQILRLLEAGAAMVLVPETPQYRGRWDAIGSRQPRMPSRIKGLDANQSSPSTNVVVLSAAAYSKAASLAGGTILRLEAEIKNSPPSFTWNAIAILRGSDPKQSGEAILITAHLDHLGVREGMAGDNIYNGADDDASGVVAVLEIARVLTSRPRPRRTVVFACFGSEERGGYGARYFQAKPPLPLDRFVANLEFEMIGRPDPSVAPHTLWLTGYDRSNLGPELAAHGARLVADPHPEQNFFQRSDNIVLARRGMIAQTVSSFGLHDDYHQPSDDLEHIDFRHMTEAINSMIRPITWLVNSTFKPEWLPGKQP